MRSTKISKWEPLPEVHDRLRAVLHRWEGTPHMDCQQAEGVGCDCVRFVAAVLDEMSSTTTDIKTLPSDASWHNPAAAWESLRSMLTSFPHTVLPKDDVFQPGDVLVVGPRAGGPGHVLIIGPDKDMWHCGESGVVRTGLGYLNQSKAKLMKAFRVDKGGW